MLDLLKIYFRLVLVIVNLNVSFQQKLNERDNIILTQNPSAVTFTLPEAVIRLTPWDFDKYPMFSMQFHTREPMALLFFVASSKDSVDSIGIELFNGKLYLFGKLLGKGVREIISNPNQMLNDGKLHTFSISVSREQLSATVDNIMLPQKLKTPAKFEFDTYTYVGGIDADNRLPVTNYVHMGFAGCINYLRVNDNQYVYLQQYSNHMTGIQNGICTSNPPQCNSQICAPGRCEERSFNRFRPGDTFYCDCSGTDKSYATTEPDVTRGAKCSVDAVIMKCDTKSYMLYHFEEVIIKHLDQFSLDFRTTNENEPLFKVKNSDKLSRRRYLSLKLENGQIRFDANLYDSSNVLYTKIIIIPVNRLNDNNWHTVKIMRASDRLKLKIDNYPEITDNLFNPSGDFKYTSDIKQIFLGSITSATNTSDKCHGEFRNFLWNEKNLLTQKSIENQYHSHLISPQTRLPWLPPFPREPAQPCSVTSDHKTTILNGINLANNLGIFLIELKTMYNGIIWHAKNSDRSDDFMSLVVVDNNLLLLYNFFGNNNIMRVALTLKGVNIQDNSWHRIIVSLNIYSRRLELFVDQISLTSQLTTSRSLLAGIKKFDFFIGGIDFSSDMMVFQQYLVRLANDVTDKFKKPEDYRFVGCFGEFLINYNNFSVNYFTLGNVFSLPKSSFVCKTCEKVAKCPVRNFCQNNGICYNQDIRTLGCNCTGTGYHGTLCDIKNPTCASISCQNGGVCQKQSETVAYCNCSRTGYTGTQCQYSNCIGFRCHNNGKCKINMARGGIPECDCTGTNFSGTYCHLANCPIGFCKNGGKCLLKADTKLPYCNCAGTGYTGYSCSNSICSNNYCGPFGRCTVVNDSPNCQCSSEYYGDRCQNPICMAGYCLNGGICSVVNKKPFCNCPPNFTGLRCEVPNQCPPNYCFNNGLCKIVNGAPQCDCSKTNAQGLRCETPIVCPPNYCLNGGRCSVIQRQLSCDCSTTSGWSGSRCEVKGSPNCPNNYCQNGGLCLETNKMFSCVCNATGYIGKFCELKSPGITCPDSKSGYAVKIFNPIHLSNKLSIILAFQTHYLTGTLICFHLTSGNYWSIKLINGVPAFNTNDVTIPMNTKVNDGNYHILKIDRDSSNFLVSINQKDVITIPIQLSKLPFLDKDILTYGSMVICNSCPIANNENSFRGNISPIQWNNQKPIDVRSLPKVGPVSNIYTPQQPLTALVPSICTPTTCMNGGLCFIQLQRTFCNCQKTQFYGKKCERPIFVIKGSDPVPGYVVHPVLPRMASIYNKWGFLFNYTGDSTILGTFVLNNSNYLELMVVNQSIYLYGNGKVLQKLSKVPILPNINHRITIEQFLDHITLYVNKTQQLSVALPNEFILPNMTMFFRNIIIGANMFRNRTIKGYLGMIQLNELQLVSNSTLHPTTVVENNIIITLIWKLNLPPLRINTNFTGSHGGIAYDFGHVLITSEGIGVGAIIKGSGLKAAALFITKANVTWFVIIVPAILIITALIFTCFHLTCCCGGGAVAGGLATKSGGAAVSASGDGAVANSNGVGLDSTKSEKVALLEAPDVEDMNQTYVSKIASAAPLLGGNNFDFEMGQFNKNLLGAGPGAAGGKLSSSASFLETTTINNNYLSLGGGGLGQGNASGTSMGAGVMGGGTMGGGTMGGSSNTNAAYMKTMKPEYEGYSPNLDITLDGAMSGSTNQELLINRDNFLSIMKVENCLLTQNGKYAVTGSVSGAPQVWDLTTGQLIKTMSGQDVPCIDLVFGLNDTMLIGLSSTELESVSTLKTLNIWDFVTGREIPFPSNPHNQYVCTAIVLSSNQQLLIVANETKEPAITLFDLTNQNQPINKPIIQLFYNMPEEIINQSSEQCYIQSLWCNTDQNDQIKYVVAGVPVGNTVTDGSINNLDNLQSINYYIVFDMTANPEQFQLVYIDFVCNLNVFAIINEEEAITGTSAGELIIWQLSTAQPLRQILISATVEQRIETKMKPHDSSIVCLAQSLDKSLIVTGGADSKVKIWDTESETLLDNILGHIDDVKSVAISNDNELLVTGSWDGSIKLWTGLQDDMGATQVACFASNIEITKVLLSNDKSTIVALGEREAISKLIMLKLYRNKNIQRKQTQKNY